MNIKKHERNKTNEEENVTIEALAVVVSLAEF